jgi:curved DNA-binding protein CbpA
MPNNLFYDHYEALQVSPNADQETIERVYRLLAKRYHPDNNSHGSQEKFDIVTKAYQTLSKPDKRAAYDATYENRKQEFYQTATKLNSSEGIDNDNFIRRYMLSILYIERRQDPENGSVGLWQLEKLLGWPEKVLEFHSWYLKQKGLIERTDSGGFAITAQGVDELERDGFILGKDRLLPETTEVQKESEKLKLIESIQVDTIGKFEEAIENLKKKVHKNQDNLIAWVFLAYLYRRLGNIDEADHAAKQVIRINPNFVISEFAKTLQIKSQETRKRFIEHLEMVGLPVN